MLYKKAYHIKCNVFHTVLKHVYCMHEKKTSVIAKIHTSVISVLGR